MQAELRGASERWFRAWLEKDAAVVERLAAEDYVYVAPNGTVMDRDGILAIIRSPSYRLDHGVRTDVVVRELGDGAAVVRHRYQGAGSFDGKSFTDDQRCVMVWEKHAGEWRLAMEQCAFSSNWAVRRAGWTTSGEGDADGSPGLSIARVGNPHASSSPGVRRMMLARPVWSPTLEAP